MTSIHMEVILNSWIEFDVSLLLNGSKEIIRILCFVSGILINVSFYIMFIWVLFSCFRTCAVQYVFLGMKANKAPWWILLQTGNIIILISDVIYKEIKLFAECFEIFDMSILWVVGVGEQKHVTLRVVSTRSAGTASCAPGQTTVKNLSKEKSHPRFSDCSDPESVCCSFFVPVGP